MSCRVQHQDPSKDSVPSESGIAISAEMQEVEDLIDLIDLSDAPGAELPTQAVRVSNQAPASDPEARICPICHSDATHDCIYLPCSHAVHGECMDRWLKHSENQDCPLCRSELFHGCGHGLGGPFFELLSFGTAISSAFFDARCGCSPNTAFICSDEDEPADEFLLDPEPGSGLTNHPDRGIESASTPVAPPPAPRRPSLRVGFQLDTTSFAAALRDELGFAPLTAATWACQLSIHLRYRATVRDFWIKRPGVGQGQPHYLFAGDHPLRDWTITGAGLDAGQATVSTAQQWTCVNIATARYRRGPHPSDGEELDKLHGCLESFIFQRNELMAAIISISRYTFEHGYRCPSGLTCGLSLPAGLACRRTLEEEIWLREVDQGGVLMRV